MTADEGQIWGLISDGIDHKCKGYDGRQSPYNKYSKKYNGCRCDDTDIPESKWCEGCLATLLDKLAGI